MKNYILVLLIIFYCLSCETKPSNKDNPNEVRAVKPSTPIDERARINALLDKALITGDEKAYNEVAAYYRIENMGRDFFYYAFAVANKYNNKEANFDVYDIIANTTPKEPKEALAKMDARTRNLALYYLLKSYEMGFESAKFQVEEIFDNIIPVPTSSYYLLEFSKE